MTKTKRYEMMKDKNGKTLKTGQIVKIEGGYFKTDNGTFVIKHSPNDDNWSGSDYSLRKCSKTGKESVSKYRTAFYPLMVTVNKLETRILAREHNKKNVTIEIIGEVKTYKVKKYNRYYDREDILIVNDAELKEMQENKHLDDEIIEEY